MDNSRTVDARRHSLAVSRRAALQRLVAVACVGPAAPQARRMVGWDEPTTEALIQILAAARSAAQGADLQRPGTALPISDDRRGAAR